MSNHRDTANLRALHDEMRCPAACAICARIEAAQDQGDDNRDYLIANLPQGWSEPPC